MYDEILEMVQLEFTRLSKDDPNAFEAFGTAWRRTRSWEPGKPRPRSLLIPYIGSGLNRLALGGLGSWQGLVDQVKEASEKPGDEDRIAAEELTKPQELELYLRRALGDKPKENKIIAAFRETFGKEAAPSSFHQRLLSFFPYIATTNYNRLLDGDNRKKYDLTDPHLDLVKFPPSHRAIVHLHGRWEPKDISHHRDQLFWGVGDYEFGEARRCLVMTEYQYHRLYAQNRRFSKLLKEILGPGSTLLFLGASLANDEAGIHAALRERRLNEQAAFPGFFVDRELSETKREFLRTRGLRSISLPQVFGFSRESTTALFHAFLDVAEKLFMTDRAKYQVPPPSVPEPEIICAGISSWTQVISLGSESPGTESSNQIDRKRFHEEAGGQHLFPALYLIHSGRRVALATTIGRDATGRRVWEAIRNFAEQVTSGGDLISYLVERSVGTRLSLVITYRGTRVIYDYDGNGPMWSITSSELAKFKKARALYFGGAKFIDFQDQLLRELPDVPFRFFETGTTGPRDKKEFPRSVALAAQCNYVLSSAAFLLRLVGKAGQLKTQQCQQKVAENCRRRNASMVRAALRRLWKTQTDRRTLVVVLGGRGSIVAVKRGAAVRIRYIAAKAVEKEVGVNWLGCGDIFRAEFIHRTLEGKTAMQAAQRATIVAAERIGRMEFLKPKRKGS